MTKREFINKLSVIFIPLLINVLYIFIRSQFTPGFSAPSILEEKKIVLENPQILESLRSSTWAQNVNQVSGYSAISVAMLLLSVAYVFEKKLDEYRKKFFQIIIFVVGISTLSYTFSLQFWNCAMDVGRSVENILYFRRIATLFQVVGWYSLVVTIMLTVALISTRLGLILSILGSLGVTFIHEIKYFLRF